MKTRFLSCGLFFYLLLGASAADWSLPTANQGDWAAGTSIGVDGGIEQYLAGGVNDRAVTGTVIDVTQAPYSADNTGATDAGTAIQSAIDAASPGDVVYLPAGRYRIINRITIGVEDSGITVRGAGRLTVLVIATGTLECFLFPNYSTSSPDTSQTVTGTKTKGTTVLSVADSSGFTAGRFARVDVENETNNTRITAGAAPTWSNSGFANLRGMHCWISAVAAGQITIEPGLPWDCTDYGVTINREANTNVINQVGVESFDLEFVSTNHAPRAMSVQRMNQSWFYDLHCTNWTLNTAAGQILDINKCYKVEVSKCKFITPSPSSAGDDGSIQIRASTSCLIADNIMVGWDSGVYEFGKSYNCALAYNYIDAGKGIIFHNGHSSMWVVEGNVLPNWQSDGYHGSGSHHTLYRNWFTGEALGAFSFQASLNRFNRYHVMAGNVFGEDGERDGQISYGNPNVGNGDSTGTAEPSAGDFWADWGMTGTLTTRTSDTAGVVTVSGGDFAATSGGSARLISLYWGGFATSRVQMTMSSRVDLALTVTGGTAGAVLPSEGEVFSGVWVFAGGYQEIDLDVENTTTTTENYMSLASGAGSVTNGTADTLPVSFIYDSKPVWFYNRSFPTIDPNIPEFSTQANAAGYRYANNDQDPTADQAVTGTRGIPLNIRLSP